MLLLKTISVKKNLGAGKTKTKPDVMELISPNR